MATIGLHGRRTNSRSKNEQKAREMPKCESACKQTSQQCPGCTGSGYIGALIASIEWAAGRVDGVAEWTVERIWGRRSCCSDGNDSGNGSGDHKKPQQDRRRGQWCVCVMSANVGRQQQQEQQQQLQQRERKNKLKMVGAAAAAFFTRIVVSSFFFKLCANILKIFPFFMPIHIYYIISLFFVPLFHCLFA